MNRRGATVALFVAFAAPVAFAQQKASPKAASKAGPLKDRLVGDWNLVAMSNTPEAGKDPRGVDRPGFMRLGKDGKFSIQVFPPKSFTGKRPPPGNAWTFVGTYKVVEKPPALDLHVTDSTFPNIEKGDTRRLVRLSGDRVVLTNPKPPKGWSAHWIWARKK